MSGIARNNKNWIFDKMLNIVKNGRNEELIEMVKSLLERCESGEVLHITWVEEMNGNKFRHSSSGTEDIFNASGKLLLMAMHKLLE